MLSAGAPGLAPAELDRLALLVGLVCSTPVGITAIRDPAEAVARHVLDALRGLPAVDAAPAGAARGRRQRRRSAGSRAGDGATRRARRT